MKTIRELIQAIRELTAAVNALRQTILGGNQPQGGGGGGPVEPK
jgi:hypothetical protein